MKEKILIILLVSVFSLGLVLASAYAAEPMSKSMKTYQVSRLLSEYLESPEGAFLGRITNFVVNSSGHIEFAIVQVGFPEVGRDSKLVTVPFGALSRPEGRYYVLNMTRERLVSAPRFNARKDLANRAFAENVYRYFGLEPSWTEGGHEKGIRSNQDPFDLVGKADTSSPMNGEGVQ